MAKESVSSKPAESDAVSQTPRRRSNFRTHRRVLLLVMTLLLVGAAILANYGPVRAYRDARARLEQASTAVSELETQKAELQSQLGKLTETGYLESLARQELAFTRPGEDLYIITGLDDESTVTTDAEAADTEEATDAGESEDSTTESVDEPGLLERAISALMGLF
jgi:cell division protein FtsB